jgi:NTE family protein
MKKRKVTLALGGGGLKGYAHIGVIAALEENGYEIAGIAGTSAGGIFGSFYAFGYTVPEILLFIDELDKSKLFQRMHNDPPSLIGLKGLYQILYDKFGDHTIDQMKIPFATTAVDINSNQEIYIDCGKVVDAVKATVAIPGVFPYLRLNKLLLVDGGVYDPIPVDLARWIAGDYPIIAVCLTPQKENSKDLLKQQIPSFSPIPSTVIEYFANLRLGKALEVFLNSMDIMQIVMADMQLQLTAPDVILRPDTSKYYFIDDVNPDELIANGRRVVEESLAEIESGVNSFRLPMQCKPGLFLSEMHDHFD